MPVEGHPDGQAAAGFFDVDGTLASSNVVLAYLDFRFHRSSRFRRWLTTTLFLPKVPFYAALDAISRVWFCNVFYRSYAEVDLSALKEWAAEAGEDFWNKSLFPEALQQLREHRANGDRIVLISGGIQPSLAPLAEMLAPDALVAAQPEMENGRLTGRLVDGPLSGDRKVRAAREISEALGVDMERSYAYADSYADHELLESVGHPVAINPDRRLRALARRRGWPVRIWSRK